MRNRRAYWSGRFLPLSERSGGFSPIAVLAGVAAVALLGTLIWKTNQILEGGVVLARNPANNPSATADSFNSFSPSSSSSVPSFGYISTNALNHLVDSYVNLKEGGSYTKTQGNAIAKKAADMVDADISFPAVTELDIQTDPDTSYKRMLSYRTDMRVALMPLLSIEEIEITTFARYIETKDENHLKKLADASEQYKKAVAALAHVVVPKDAVSHHVGIMNALSQFSATLDAMTGNVGDSLATLALMRAYNTAEQNVFTAFNTLASYETKKIP